MLPIQAELSEVIAVTVGSLILYPPQQLVYTVDSSADSALQK